MVTASGSRPAKSSAAHSITAQRSFGVSLATSVARPITAMPWLPPAMQMAVWRRIASRSSVLAAVKKAYRIGQMPRNG